jgi:hypothetical protein
MSYSFKIYSGILLLMSAMSGICVAKDVYNPASQEVIVSLIQSTIKKITELSVECVLIESEGQFEASDTSTLWAIRENHDQTCGGDPNTAPVIQRLVSVHKPDEESIALFLFDIECMCVGRRIN